MTDPGAGGLRVYALGHRTLEAVQMAALDMGVVLPDKQVVGTGEVAHDCEMVAVTALRLITGIPDAAQGAGFPGALSGGGFCAPTWSLIMNVEIVRCAPLWPEDGNGVVAASAINDATIPTSKDAEVIINAVNNLAANPHNFGDVVSNIQFLPPSGGFVVTLGQVTSVLA